MALIQPNGIIRVLQNTGLNNTYQHTRYFASVSAQTAYFSGKTKYTFSDQSYSRPSRGFIRVQRKATELYDCDYLMFQNNEYGDKWFYAFITSIDYISNNTSQINFELDDIQSWWSEWSRERCYVKRCHVSDDTIGEHIEPEPVSIGQKVLLNHRADYFFSGDISSWKVLVYASKARSEGNAIKSMGVRGGMFQGLYCNVFDTPADFKTWLDTMTDEAYADWSNKIVQVVWLPPDFITQSAGGLDANSPYKKSTILIPKEQSTLGNHTVRNNKLFTYPYNCMYITDGDRNKGEYAYEFFNKGSANCRFACVCAIQPNPEIMVVPYGYAGVGAGDPNYEYKMVMADIPPVPWVTDSYRQWLGTARMGLALSVANSAFNVLGGMTNSPQSPNYQNFEMGVAGGYADTAPARQGAKGGLMTGAQMALNWDYEKQVHRYIPDTVHTTSAGAMVADKAKTFHVYQKCVNEYDAKIIDDFFDVFGYAVNRKMIPPIHNRQSWTYVKTANAEITGNAPADVLGKIASIFNNGITFWSSGTIGDYSQSNNTI